MNDFNKLSYSAWKKFKDCPFAFKCTYIDKIKTDSQGSVHTVYGQAFHYVIEQLLKGTIVIEDSQKTFIDHFLEVSQKCNIPTELDKWLAKFNIEFANFEPYYYKYKSGIITTEQRFKIPHNDFELVGVMDYTRSSDFVLELKDWKTGKYFEDSGQLKFYAFAQSKLMDLSKIKEIKGTLHFVSCNKLYNTLIKPEEITETQKEIENFVKEVRHLSEFPKTNKNCFFCDHRELCKANDNPFVGKVRIKKNEPA